jgi:peptidoglycan hydrolase-like protein with peptidoglycan-binding domain
MLRVESGEKNASVVALQILLNRDPAIRPKLVTDGSFGAKTAAAVDKFRAEVMLQSGPKGVADPPMWSFLLTRAELQVIDFIDITDPAVLVQALPNLTSPFPILIESGGMSNGIAQLVTEIRVRARGEQSIMMLRLHGHGGPGLMAISAGSRHSTGGIDGIAAQSVMTPLLLQTLAPVLSQIAPLMHNFGFVELHSCRVAQGANGMGFVRHLANIIRAPVRAALSKQKMDKVYVLVGPTFSGFPGNATLRQWGLSRKEAVQPSKPQPYPLSPFKDADWSPFKDAGGGWFKDTGGPFK